MSTHALIAVRGLYENPDVFSVIYCHWDGHFETAGKTLFTHYNNLQKITQLIALGDISELKEEIGEKQNFSRPTHETWTVAYHRDRDEDWQRVQPVECESLKEIADVARDCGAQFLYVYEDKQWYGAEMKLNIVFLPLDNILTALDK